MSYHQDWLMRQIEAISAMLGYILTGKKASTITVEEDQPNHSGDNELYFQLQALVRQGKICQAEDLLYEAMEDPDSTVLDAAKRFYDDLNRLSDKTLRDANFSREEIHEGLQEVCRTFGIPI
jgi:hypothetical protein